MKEDEEDHIDTQKYNNLITIINPKYSVTGRSMGEIVISLYGSVYWFDIDIEDDTIGEKLGKKGTFKLEGYEYPLKEEFEGYKLNRKY